MVDLICPECGRVCKSPAGLASHRRIHTEDRAPTRRRAPDEGSIYQRADGRWVAQVHLGYTAAGNHRYLRRIRTSRRRAADALGELQRIVARDLDPAQVGQPLSRWLRNWLKSLDGVRAPKTVAAYAADVAHIDAVIGGIRLDRLAPGHVRQLMAALPGRGLAPKSQANVRATLHTAIRQAVKDRIIDWNPVAVVDRPRVERYDPRPLPVDQARAVLDALADDRLVALYAVAVAVGLRLSEALGLTWQRIDLDAGVVQVRHQTRRVGPAGDRHYTLADLKNRRVRDVPLPGFAVDRLAEHRLRQREERLASERDWVDGCCHGCEATGWGLVFTTSSHRSAGRPVHETQARKHFQDACETTVGFRPRFHDLRHTSATLLLAQGVPLHEVSQILGHSGIAVTKDVYGHLQVEHLRGAADTMGRLLG